MKFDQFKDNFSIPKAEEKIIAFWDQEDVFKKSLELAKDKKPFVFFEGPPTANGRPGIHHVIARTVKDLICRYKSMKGYRVDRKGGWDTHGLPVEIEVEKRLKLESKAQIVEFGIKEFNEECKKSVFKYLKEWNAITKRTGYWLDLEDSYVTLENEYIESVWYILKDFFDRDLIYKGHKIVPYCPRCGTGLSSHEVSLGYQMVKDPSIIVKFQSLENDYKFLVWTTTPWTLPSNAALAMKADADYALVEHEGEKYVLAEALIEKVFGEALVPLEKFKGKDFVGQKYEPLFDFYKDEAGAFVILNADFVTLEDGAGIVHIAPGFGAEDYEVGKKHKLPMLQAIRHDGHFKELAGNYAGMFIKDADLPIIKDLKIAGKLFKKELYEHSYPFCWRCDSPLIYIARESWYIKTTQFKEQLLKNNNEINWYPDEIRTGRMLNWLENNVDWAISRERFWGTPLPIWICQDENCGERRAVGSIAQLKKEAVSLPDELDLHKPMMDEVQLTCQCGSLMNRVPEVIDVWFDSGAMPFAQWHYPFENKENFDNKYPADFISEGIDQTRGWFYSLLAISTMLSGKAPFKNVIVLEFILDKEGKKMSKHKGNVVDPFETVDKYGADPLRWYMISVSNPWLPTKFDLEGIGEVIRKYFDTLRNTYSFFALYSNIDAVQERAAKENLSISGYLESSSGDPERFDKWILSRYNSLIKEVTESIDNYDLTKPVRAIQSFVIEDLSNWYVRNNRKRFWAKGDDPSKMRAYYTLHKILVGVCQLSAPVIPMISELFWQELTGNNREKYGHPLSIHMTEFPLSDEAAIDKELEKNMTTVEKIVSLGRAARSRKNLKIRQPLSRLLIGRKNDEEFDSLLEYLDIIKDELNIKEILSVSDINQHVTYSAKLNFKVAGTKLGGLVKKTAALLGELSSEEVKDFAGSGRLQLEVEGEQVRLTEEDVNIIKTEKEGFAVETDAQVSIVIETTLSDELLNEGFARELVNKIQNMRKSTGLEVTDQIKIRLSSSERLISAAREHEEFIKKETLANSMEINNGKISENAIEWNINGETATIEVAKSI